MIALLGRRDHPTDGVEDYCVFLGRALAERGIELKLVRVSWDEKGWSSAVRDLRRKSADWRGQWVLVQYTTLAWSRRGFPFRALAILATLQRAGARMAVIFHDPCNEGGTRWIDRLRSVCQHWVIRRLHRRAEKAIFTVPLDTVPWLPKETAKAAFIPIGANIPERASLRPRSGRGGRQKTVIVFGVTGEPRTDGEVEEITSVVKEASKTIGKLRLVVVGRGAPEAQAGLEKALEGASVELVVRGVLPAEEIAGEFERADALLFVRGAITLRRGSALAGIACGLPIVGYRNGVVGEPLEQAGIEWSPWRDRDALARGLVRVLSDSARWAELHERNLAAQSHYFAWERIADRYRMVLAG